MMLSYFSAFLKHLLIRLLILDNQGYLVKISNFQNFSIHLILYFDLYFAFLGLNVDFQSVAATPASLTGGKVSEDTFSGSALKMFQND